jgi:predicted DNA-binding antitoxin AbrB/MazE fold protein
MTIRVEATYEGGVLKPDRPLPLREHQKVEVVIRSPGQIQAALEAVRRGPGMIGWAGDTETLRRIALDPRFDVDESP